MAFAGLSKFIPAGEVSFDIGFESTVEPADPGKKQRHIWFKNSVPAWVALAGLVSIMLMLGVTIPAIADPGPDSPSLERPDDRGDDMGQGQGDGTNQGGPNGQGRGNGQEVSSSTTTSTPTPTTSTASPSSTTTVTITSTTTTTTQPTNTGTSTNGSTAPATTTTPTNTTDCVCEANP